MRNTYAKLPTTEQCRSNKFSIMPCVKAAAGEAQLEIRTLRKPALIAGSVATAFLLMKFLRRPAVKQKLGDIFDAGCTKLDHLRAGVLCRQLGVW